MARIKICKEGDCQNASTTEGFCRLHYLRNWKTIRDGKHRRAAKKLNSYIEDVIRRHPDRYMEVIKKDLRSPQFNRYVEETFGHNEEEEGPLLDEPTYDEEIERLIKQLKIEKGF